MTEYTMYIHCLLVVLIFTPQCTPLGVISLATTSYIVTEGAQFEVSVLKQGTASSTINVVVQVENPYAHGSMDFIGTSQTSVFPAGTQEVIGTLTFTTRDDVIPEPDETFDLVVFVTNGDGVIGSPVKGTVTIAANDDSFGVFGFSVVSPVFVEEKAIDHQVALMVERSRGTFSIVEVHYEISGAPEADLLVDIGLSTGVLTFYEGETSKALLLPILTDDVPEGDETFIVRLTDAQGGDSMSAGANRPKINTTLSEVSVVISQNDAPVRIARSEYRVDEAVFDFTLRITVYRGLSENGSSIVGPVNKAATVIYHLLPLTATPGLDYLPSNGTIGFSPGITESVVIIQILSDALPETAERFRLVLSSPTGNVVLTEPYACDVIINANDDFNGVLSLRTPPGDPFPKVVVNEDTESLVDVFTIQRSGGRYGTVSVEWALVYNETGQSSPDVLPSMGTAVLMEGESEKAISVQVVQDTIAEPTERYVVRLLPGSVTGGARAEGILQGVLVIQDSDGAHGTVEFSSADNHRLDSGSSPRKLQLLLTRTGGTLGTLQVSFNVTYTVRGEQRPDVLLSAMPGVTLFPDGAGTHTLEVWIRDEAFLEVEGVFLTSLTSISLTDPLEDGPYNTPVLGGRITMAIVVTIDAANGEVGFADTATRTILEPDGVTTFVTTVLLPVSRVGTNGEVMVFWTASGSGPNPDHVTDTDIQPRSGMLRMPSGQASSNILLEILPDSLAETDEYISVTLTRLDPPESQRLRPAATTVSILVLENDNPGGVFQFSSQMALSHTVQEELDAIDVVIERTGGALVERDIEYYISPGGGAEFYGDTNVIRFLPGEAEHRFTIIARGDGVPELTEDFELKLRSFGEKTARIGLRDTVNITVVANDAPYGFLQFPADNFTLIVDESKGADVRYANVPVQRIMGRFEMTTVEWFLTDADTNIDLSPVRGTLTFDPGVGEVTIDLHVLADEIPEEEEMFYVNITSPSGPAALGEYLSATVIIQKNDDPIYFLDATPVEVAEPSTFLLTVVRGGSLDMENRVKYRTVDGSATEAGRDYVIITEAELVFSPGETNQTITVTVLEDPVAEADEAFYVELYDAVGDVAVYGPPAEIIIMSNDGSNGVFRFSLPNKMAVQEGAPAQFEVVREKGFYDEADVYYRIYDNVTGSLVPEGEDFISAIGVVRFSDRQRQALLTVTPSVDSIPEYDEVFRIVLYNVTGGREEDPGRLADYDQEVYLTVALNDDPFGVFSFADSSHELSIAEDYYPGDEVSTQANLTVERKQGALTTVQVVWEVFSYQIAGAGNLPILTDLLFLGEVPPGVREMNHLRRPGTGTKVLAFDGCADCYVEIPAMHHTPKADIENGFSISAWLQPKPNTAGYVLAKTSHDASVIYYALKVATAKVGDFNSLTLTFQYSIRNTQGLEEQQELSLDIADGALHFVLICVDNGQIYFYVDGVPRGTRALAGESAQDGAGVLLVGALPPGVQKYQGLMQDVRVYSRKLDKNEIREVYETPSYLDLDVISGYLTFPEGARSQDIVIRSMDDVEEEANDVFSVKLISALGGARVSENDATATLTVLKSDNANGLFGFSGVCTPLWGQQEGALFTCPVSRSRGDTDVVMVTWEVTGGSSGPSSLAAQDFVNATGVLVFEAGEREKMLVFQGYDDDVPERQETFDVTLTAVESSDGLIGSTNQSGASIHPEYQVNNITMATNDYPFGLLQFSVLDTPPLLTGEEMIEPVNTVPLVSVPEEVGEVSLLVVRAHGRQGTVTVEWRTVDGTARSSGQSQPDYMSRVDSLTFEPGQSHAWINITILDNSLPEAGKFFTAELLNPRVQPVIGSGSELTGSEVIGVGVRVKVVIEHSDQAYGVFQFAEGSLYVTDREEGDSGYSVIDLKVVREGGSIGSANLTWRVNGDFGNDLLVTSGSVEFVDGQKEGEIKIEVWGDSVPELDEMFDVEIINVTQGTLGDADKLHSEVTILANDDPYGVFVIMQSYRPITVEEKDAVIPIVIQRKASSGRMGDVIVYYETLEPWELYTFLPGGTLRADYHDYDNVTGSVVMAAGETSAVFNVTIKDDTEPEMEEALFVRLTGVQLIRGEQERPVVGSPRLGTNVETYAQVLIQQNDSPNGVLDLSASEVKVREDFVGPLVSIVRTAGAFGAVSVRFEVSQGTATQGLDYSVVSTDVMLLSGERNKSLPIDIINDSLPEPEESFTVRLLGPAGGGATLGARTQCVVTIEQSDDLNGAFAFESPLMPIEEPDSGDLVVEIPVIRLGGTRGLVAVEWQATSNGTEDITPMAGTIYFVSNEARQMIRVSVLGEEEPEGLETIEFVLLSANSGGRIETGRNRFTLQILPNDNPHGTVEFSGNNYFVDEDDVQGLQYIPLTRSGGSYGELRVFYHATELSLTREATLDGSSLYDFFSTPEPGVGPTDPSASTKWNVNNQPDTLMACLTYCFLTEACRAFYFSRERVDCSWFTIDDQRFLDNRTGYLFYTKDMQMMTPLYDIQAKASIDFEATPTTSITIPDGASEGLLPVRILQDDLPELDERFTITVTRVELTGSLQVNPMNLPQLGERRQAYVTIATNDDANGVFRIYSNDPRALDDGQVIPVEEREKLSVELVVERQGGSIGEVSVTWFVNLERTTASRVDDFIADGATLTYLPGETLRIVTVGIEDDSVPENDETIVIELRDPVGGAVISPRRKSVTVSIVANDYVAGLLGFQQTSNIVREGDVVTLTLERSAPALGDVSVRWRVITTDSDPPDVRFRTTSGQLYFRQGEREKDILLHVQVDNQPKINQAYTVQLYNILTRGVGETGAAAAHPQRGEAYITIQGGNEPHGVFSFSSTLLSGPVRVDEGTGTYNLTVDRKFGAIGIVRVLYTIRVGALQPLTTSLNLASPGDDFTTVTNGSILFAGGQTSGSALVEIVEDAEPEVDEVFVAELTGIELVEPSTSTFLPRIAADGRRIEVIINANDGTQGEVIFAPQSASVMVEEEVRSVSLVIQRTKGAFGSVSVYCYAQNVISKRGVTGAVRGEDFLFRARDIQFAPGETEKVVVLTILQDDFPEPDESLEVILDSPKAGLVLGNPRKALVTIMSNDVANGVVNFDTSSNVTISEPPDENTAGSVASVTAMGSVARLTVIRGPGIYGVVTVQYRIVPAVGGEGARVTDLTPPSGVVTFNDREASTVLELRAVADSEPEEAEVFYVYLSQPEGGATLGSISEKIVIIEKNDAPYGLLQLYPTGSRESSLSVEETVGLVYFDVVRSHGDMGRISVDMVTGPGSALTQPGFNLSMLLIQQLDELVVTRWYSFEAHGLPYVLLLNQEWVGPLLSNMGSSGAAPTDRASSITPSMLYKWQGVLLPLQTVETDGAFAAEAFSIDGEFYLFVVNHGQNGRHTTKSRLYSVGQDGLVVLQEFSTRGATDAAYFHHQGQHYVLVSNFQDNRGQTRQRSDLYHWESTNKRLSSLPVRYLETVGAAAVEVLTVEGVVYLAVASFLDSNTRTYSLKSVIYKFDSSQELTVHQQIPTDGATDITSFHTDTDAYLIIANQRDNFGDTAQGVMLFTWNSLTEQFVLIQELPSVNVQHVHMFWLEENGKYNLIVASLGGGSAVYEWDVSIGQFVEAWSGLPYRDLYPLQVPQPPGGSVYILEAPDVTERSLVGVYGMTTQAESDYFSRSVTVTFKPRQTSLTLPVHIINDAQPEDTENLYVYLTNQRQGAELGPDHNVTVYILSNDNGHGVIEFAQDSLVRYEEETPGGDNEIQLNVMRHQGDSGRVVVRWSASGGHQGIYDLNPIEGTVEFADGQSAATISITIRDDSVAELDEVTVVTLLEVIETGSQLPDRGASIGGHDVCRLTVLANDSPFGVVHWEFTNYTVDEPEQADTSVLRLNILRSQGTMGAIKVFYTTQPSEAQPAENKAISGLDYITSLATLDMADSVSMATIELTILADSIPEMDEYFLVNLTDVQLLDSSPVGGARPSVRRPGGVATVRITENDNVRGTIEFSVNRNAEGRLDVYEGIGTIELPLVRSVGLRGTAEVTWQAVPREANTQDFTPSGGTVRFEEGDATAVIAIYIEDDRLAESLETFSVELLSVTTGGAVLGSERVVRVGIIKNDSPNGVVSFLTSRESVKESKMTEDPEGLVSFTVTRQGAAGEVELQWRLSANASDDIMPPLTGNLHFTDGETLKAITLRTKPDSIIEGQEIFILTLVSATNNADISPLGGTAELVVLPDEGATGVVSVVDWSREVYIGEPAQGYDGTARVTLTRGSVAYGEVKVRWQITPQDLVSFSQTQGEVWFNDQESNTDIILQAQDDSLPEMRDTYTLELISASVRAAVDPERRRVAVVIAASDYPHGLFEFSEPSQVTVQENQQYVTVTVERHYGNEGRVQVYYTTSPGSAHSDVIGQSDFRSASDWLVFNDGERRKMFDIEIINDNRAEPTETFFINLTNIELLFPRNNNYTEINGLALDMAPEIGPLAVQTFTIDKNDGAEGVIEFDETAIGFIADEEEGIARIPVKRTTGIYGEVSASYRSREVTARAGIDYTLPEGRVTFPDSVMLSYINVTIENDDIREYEETFEVELTQANGGAVLGSVRRILVTIATSDYPNGKFSFQGETEITVPNPDQLIDVTLAIGRTEGLIGQQTLLWRIMGPNDANRVLEETGDLSYFDGALDRETTEGQLVWGADTAGTRSITLQIKPRVGWEIAKTYIIAIYDIQGFPADTGSGQPSPDAGNFTVTIAKFGFPNGIVRFDGIAQAPRSLDEPEEGSTRLVFPLVRMEGTTGTIKVHWRVVEVPAVAGNVTDVSPVSGVVEIPPGVNSAEVILSVLADDVPEIDESFSLQLVEIDGGGDISTTFNTSNFKISYNDAPHGVFAIYTKDQSIVVQAGTLKRRLSLNITRTRGQHGRVRVDFTIRYNQAESGLSYAPATGSVLFNTSQSQAVVLVNLESQRFLGLNTTFTVTLSQATYIGNRETEPPGIHPQARVAIVTVPIHAANSRVGFHTTVASIDEVSGLAELVVYRHGAYGSITVDWASGFHGNNIPPGYRQGTLNPQTGAVTMAHGVQQAAFTVQVLPEFGADLEIFAVSLLGLPVTSAPGGAMRWEGHQVATIEPHGVIQFSVESRDVYITESDLSNVEVTLHLERVFGSQDSIQIRYHTVSGSATGGADYRPIDSGAITMDPKQIASTIFIEILKDDLPETDEQFFVNFTSVTKLPIAGQHGKRSLSRFHVQLLVIADNSLSVDHPSDDWL